MTYVALLRGINVGGNRKVPMSQLATVFERLGHTQVKTFIASGNVIFCSDVKSREALIEKIEAEIKHEFGFEVPIVLRSLPEITQLVKEIPDAWVNDTKTKCDVMFLQTEIDSPEILSQIPHNPDIEDVLYLPGAVVWRIDRDKATRGQVLKINGTDMYKRMTIRNPNTVRKILTLMQATSGS